ncbi:hypothetical protein [Actinomadura algeriensis]|uniref:Transcriptional regulator with XRE-family HTH domain n=1 Tax=Actinomadura algeriensis TaxID=1679523 RepID=A0ABR9K395_9ACTN|nr:hypothetical protein [Actinomadura algeriensis]MBE1537074.1 transcriptional regulator with XRE-family HTH domain [Actinomadura algeriensis]
MSSQRKAGADVLRRLRTSRGWSWTDLAGHLRAHARTLHIARIAAAQVSSIRRTIARWESGSSIPDEQYQLLLGHAYARTSAGSVAIGPGSDFTELLDALGLLGVPPARRDEITAAVGAAVTGTGTNLLAFLGTPLRAELATALARPETLSPSAIAGLDEATRLVDTQIGVVPFVRLHLAQAAVVEVCRQLLRGEQAAEPRAWLRAVASRAFTLAARLAFETRDDTAALSLYDEAVATAGEGDLAQRAHIRTSQTMVAYYSTGDIDRARRTIDAAVQDARRGDSPLMRARAHALQAEMAVRGASPQRRQAQASLHLAWHDLDVSTEGDPMPGVFDEGRLQGFEGVCGIFLGEAESAEAQLEKSIATLTGSRQRVQRAIVLTDHALARLHSGGPGAPESAAERLHECVDLAAETGGRVPTQRLRRARMELRPWRQEPFVADLDDHIHTTLIGA